MRPKHLIITALVLLFVYIGAIGSGNAELQRDNWIVALAAFAWPLFLIAGVIWAIVRRFRRSEQREIEQPTGPYR